MNVVDAVLIIGMLVFAVTGWKRGFVYGLLSLIGFLAGAAVGLWLAPRVVGSWQPGIGTAVVALVIVFLAAGLGQVLVGLGGKRLKEAIVWKPLVKLDAAAGAVLSVLAFLLVSWFVADLFVHGNQSSLAKEVRHSQVLGFVDEIVPDAADGATGQLKSMWNESGFPDVFSGFGTEPVSAVPKPSARILRQPAVQHAAAQTVKIVGPTSCDSQLEGTGFAFAPERVLTNAHVVAGVDRPVLYVGGDGNGYPARVVYFDPDQDLAVLAVPGLPARPLPLEDQVRASQDVGIVGYPEGGPLTGTAGRVRSVQRASGHDIYGSGTVVREVLSIRAEVRPGNSGGPVLDAQGRVVGVVFAVSLDHAETTYAMTSPWVASAVSTGLTATEPVDTGRCA